MRALWAPSGRFFVTGSYDHSLCVYRYVFGKIIGIGPLEMIFCALILTYFRASAGEESYELEEKIAVNGAVEGVAFAKVRARARAGNSELKLDLFVQDADEFVVGIRGDYLLHCYSLSSEKLTEVKQL